MTNEANRPCHRYPRQPSRNVDATRVAAVGLADGAGQAPLRLGHGDQVDVVGHQTVRPDLDAAGGAVPGHERQVRLVVGVREERRQPPIAALRDMMRVTRNHHSRQPCHTNSLTPKASHVKPELSTVSRNPAAPLTRGRPWPTRREAAKRQGLPSNPSSPDQQPHTAQTQEREGRDRADNGAEG